MIDIRLNTVTLQVSDSVHEVVSWTVSQTVRARRCRDPHFRRPGHAALLLSGAWRSDPTTARPSLDCRSTAHM
jgi:hypothetical protein